MFHFTIRDVLWLTVVAALVVGWGMDRYRTAQHTRVLQGQQDELRARQVALDRELSNLRLRALWQKELRGEVILTPSLGRSVK
jgi:hypothetical protein